MTSPIIIQQGNAATDIQSGVNSFFRALQSRQAAGLERQKVEAEMRRIAAQNQQSAQATAESRQRVEGMRQELETRGFAAEASEAGSGAFIELLTSADGVSPAAVAAAQVQMSELDENIRNGALETFNNLAQEHLQTQFNQARNISADVGARLDAAGETSALQLIQSQAELAKTEALVAARTADARIANTNLQDDATRQRIFGLDISNQLAASELENDPTRQRLAESIWVNGAATGITYGQARRQAGVRAVEGGVPDDTVYVDPSPAGGAGGNAASDEAAGFMAQMITSNIGIDFLEANGGGISAFAAVNRSTKNSVIQTITNAFISPHDRQLLVVHKQFATSFRFFVSGQQSSDAEALSLMTIVAGQVGDDSATLAAKSRVRREVIAMVDQMQRGTVSPVTVIERGIRAAREVGDNPDFIRYMQTQLVDARAHQARLEAGTATAIPANVTQLLRPDLPEAAIRDTAYVNSIYGPEN